MIAVDTFVCVASSLYLYNAIAFVRAARRNVEQHKTNTITQEHFTDHLYACVVGLLGGSLSFVFSILHFLAQNIFTSEESILSNIEYGSDLGIVFVFVSGVMFMAHMTREETPGHPYFVQEYGDKI